MYYIKMTAECDFTNIELGNDNNNGDYSEYVCSTDEQIIRNAIDIIKKTVENEWLSGKHKPFQKGNKYYWVTTSSKGHLRHLTIQEGIIPDNVSNQKYNYFESLDEAIKLKDRLETTIKLLP